MVQITLNILRYRLKVSIAQKRRGSRDKLLAALDETLKVRIGSRVSRLVRLLVSGKRIQRILGGMLAGLIILTNLYPPISAVTASWDEPEIVALPAGGEPIVTSVARRFPIDGRPAITQGYHRFHSGVDINGNTGDPVYPIMNGRVESLGREFFLGKTVTVNHANGYKSVYAHLDTIGVSVGGEVNTNTKIGEVGSTGRTTGSHLHLEVYKNDRSVNPMTILPRR